MSLAKMIAARMLAKKPKAPAPCHCKPNPFQCGAGCRCAGCGHAVKSESTVAPARSQVHRGAPLPRPRVVAPEPELAQVVAALPLPPPTPDVPAPVLRTGWVGSCKAIDADTGRRCRLLAHPGEAHRHERGPFFRTAAPGQSTFTVRAQLDAAATRRFTTETL